MLPGPKREAHLTKPWILSVSCRCRKPVDSSFFGCDNGSLPRETQLALTRGLLTAFFNLYLKDDQAVWRDVWGPELYGEPLIDNTTPGPGLDVNEITAVLKSVGKCHSTRNSTTATR